MTQSVYADIEELNKQNILDQTAELPLPNAATRISMDPQYFPRQKLAVTLIAAFKKSVFIRGITLNSLLRRNV